MVIYPPGPQVGGLAPLGNPALPGMGQPNEMQWGPFEPIPGKGAASREVRPSSPESKQRSLHLQGQGDFWFHKQNYAQANARYQHAAAAASDVAAPHFRSAIALTAMNRYEQAVAEIKKGLSLDPSWPTTGESLTELFGENNELAKQAMLHELAEDVREDIRNPDLLFLFAVCLHFDGDRERAATVFEAAARLTAPADHIQVFLNAPPAAIGPPPARPEALPPVNPKSPPFQPAPLAEPAAGARPSFPSDDADAPRPESVVPAAPAGPKLPNPAGPILPPNKSGPPTN
jgi:hypothetical protein